MKRNIPTKNQTPQRSSQFTVNIMTVAQKKTKSILIIILRDRSVISSKVRESKKPSLWHTPST